MKSNFVFIGIAVALAGFGWLAGSRQSADAQIVDSTVPPTCEWRMFSENVAGTGGGGGSSAGQGLISSTGSPGRPVYGTSWMYHSCSGEVRRMFDGCGAAYPDGCAFVLPVLQASESASGFQPNMKTMDRQTP